MKNNDKLKMLEQVAVIADTNILLMGIANECNRSGKLDQSDNLLKAGRHLLDACAILNQLGAEIEANPWLN